MDSPLVALVENGVVYYVRTDHIGRPVFATDATGAKVWEATYLPFGGMLATWGSFSFPGATPPPPGRPPALQLRFPGQWFQAESGLHQNWMRDYDPTTGRYMQADPLGLVDGASVYGYARQNPGRYTDPRGELLNPEQGRSIGFGWSGRSPNTSQQSSTATAGAAAAAAGQNAQADAEADGAANCQTGCSPCKTVSGRTVGVGTIAYRPLDTPDRPQHGIDGPHYNVYRANQIPAPVCDCFWQTIGAVRPHELPSGAIPIEPFQN